MSSPRCPDCKAFCGVVYRWRGESMVEVRSCIKCGRNPPQCSHEDGSVKGCQNNATHEGSFREARRNRPWCIEHKPDNAKAYTYYK